MRFKAPLRKLAITSAIIVSLVASAKAQEAPAIVEEQEGSDAGWQFEGNLYLWGTDIKGKTTAGQTVEISFDDILDNLNFAALGGLQARRDKWYLFFDGIYLNIGNSENFSRSVGPVDVNVESDINLKTLITTAGGGYQIYKDNSTELYATGGIRYLRINVDLDLEIGPFSRSVDETYDAFDAVVGLRGNTEINDRWYLSYYADYGRGDSDHTWQALAALNYRFERFDVAVGYRYMDYNLDDFGPFDTLEIKGPFIGVRFRF